MRSLDFLTYFTITTSIVSLSVPGGAFAQTNVAPLVQQRIAPAPSATVYTAPSVAYGNTIDSVGNGAIPALPLEEQVSNGVSFINGGIGDEELAELKNKAGEFNLHVMLSAPKGEYISDVSLRILDSAGATLVSVDDAGPYFYAHMNAGHYTLETTNANGEKKAIKLAVPEKGTLKEHVVFSEQ